jgi:hypothetical protein
VSSTAADWGYDNAADVTSVTIGDFTVKFSQGTGTYTPKYYSTDGTMRLYSGNTVTVTSNNSEYTPTKFGNYELSNGSYTFDASAKFKKIVITFDTYVNNVVVGDLKFDIRGSAASVTGYQGSDTWIDIPSKIEYDGQTYPVTSIGSSAFSYCTGLTSVTIPNSVTSIEYYAFYGCSDCA